MNELEAWLRRDYERRSVSRMTYHDLGMWYSVALDAGELTIIGSGRTLLLAVADALSIAQK